MTYIFLNQPLKQLISKEISGTELEYMNMQPFPPISVLDSCFDSFYPF